MIKVSPLQRGNSVLNYLSQTLWHYEDGMTADYEVNGTTGILFLSLRFHSCKPEYIHKRIRRLKAYKLQVLLVHVDVANYNRTVRELLNSVLLTMVLGFSNEECSRYIQGFNVGQSINAIRRRENDQQGFLGRFPLVNKTDVGEVMSRYGSVGEFLLSGSAEMEKIKGFGKAKAESISRYVWMGFK